MYEYDISTEHDSRVLAAAAVCALESNCSKGPDNDRMIAAYILKPIRKVCITLQSLYIKIPGPDHAPTGFSISILHRRCAILWSPTSYPLCNIPGHHTFHAHDDSASTTFARTDLRDDAALPPASLSSPDAPSSSVLASLHVLKSLADVPPLDDFHPVHQTTTESLRTPVSHQIQPPLVQYWIPQV